jgi:tetratricopeptide (TPR) repeat protein
MLLPLFTPSAPGPSHASIVLAVQEEAPLDVVYLRDGSAESGELLEATLAGLALKPADGERKLVPWSSVLMVQYGDAPDEFANAQATLYAGNFEAALEDFQTTLGFEDLRPALREEALFLSAHARQRLGQVDEARTAYAEVLKEFPQGRYARAAGESLIELHLAAGDAPGARAALDQLGQGLQGVEGRDGLVALLEAGLLAASGSSDEALQRYSAVEGLSGVDPVVAQEARLGRARMLLAGGKGAQAEPLLRALVAESQDPRVQSGAWNALGEIQASEGRSRKEADRILDALYHYLRTVVQYKPLPGESTHEFERALAGAGTCFQYLSELEQNADKKRLLRDHQRERLEQLQREFPNSKFLK